MKQYSTTSLSQTNNNYYYFYLQPGTLRFCGLTDFASGEWGGIELDEAVGKNDGSVGGVFYFQCAPKYGKMIQDRSWFLGMCPPTPPLELTLTQPKALPRGG